eukprot:gb/GFBE01057537.1/.p1 GENE.gb/GFBE01057537.1/~~gb/GFBE01057537.1/.p1  ORF type:complete len:239 (+),score=58.32 gb/GFBE01057537.1/:1-717(+)
MLFLSCCDSSEDKTTQATYASSSHAHEEDYSTTKKADFVKSAPAITEPHDEIMVETEKANSEPADVRVIELAAAVGYSSLGVDVDNTDDGKPIIKEVAPAGAAAAWNMNNPDNQILPFDAILGVNGEDVQGAALPEQLEFTGGKITLRLKRPTERTVVLKRPGALGLTVNYKKRSASPWVASIEEGLLANFNKENPDGAIAVGDRLLSVNDRSGDTLLLLKALKEAEHLTLKFLHYSP